MSTPQSRKYNREWMRKYRKKKAREVHVALLKKEGKCIFCEMYLNSEYHKKYPCKSYLKYIHTKIENNKK